MIQEFLVIDSFLVIYVQFQSYGSLGEQFLLFCLKIVECPPTHLYYIPNITFVKQET